MLYGLLKNKTAQGTATEIIKKSEATMDGGKCWYDLKRYYENKGNREAYVMSTQQALYELKLTHKSYGGVDKYISEFYKLVGMLCDAGEPLSESMKRTYFLAGIDDNSYSSLMDVVRNDPFQVVVERIREKAATLGKIHDTKSPHDTRHFNTQQTKKPKPKHSPDVSLRLPPEAWKSMSPHQKNNYKAFMHAMTQNPNLFNGQGEIYYDEPTDDENDMSVTYNAPTDDEDISIISKHQEGDAASETSNNNWKPVSHRRQGMKRITKCTSPMSKIATASTRNKLHVHGKAYMQGPYWRKDERQVTIMAIRTYRDNSKVKWLVDKVLQTEDFPTAYRQAPKLVKLFIHKNYKRQGFLWNKLMGMINTMEETKPTPAQKDQPAVKVSAGTNKHSYILFQEKLKVQKQCLGTMIGNIVSDPIYMKHQEPHLCCKVDSPTVDIITTHTDSIRCLSNDSVSGEVLASGEIAMVLSLPKSLLSKSLSDYGKGEKINTEKGENFIKEKPQKSKILQSTLSQKSAAKRSCNQFTCYGAKFLSPTSRWIISAAIFLAITSMLQVERTH
jgi:hypothetical protein